MNESRLHTYQNALGQFKGNYYGIIFFSRLQSIIRGSGTFITAIAIKIYNSSLEKSLVNLE